MSVLEERVAEIRELLRPGEGTLRGKVHVLWTERTAEEKVAQALEMHAEARRELAATRDRRTTRLREWGSFALAAAAVIVTVHPWTW